MKQEDRAKANELAQHADIFLKEKDLVYSGLSPRIKYLENQIIKNTKKPQIKTAADV